MTDLPDPLTPADCDLRGYDYMPLYGDRLFTSETWLGASPAAKSAMLPLWWRAYAHEIPAASLPDNDALLASYAGFGVAVAQWRKIKAQAMRGWVKCSDGRLYHPVVAEIALEAWQARLRAINRGSAGAAKRWSKHKPSNAPSIEQASANQWMGDSKREREERKGKESSLRSDSPPPSEGTPQRGAPPGELFDPPAPPSKPAKAQPRRLPEGWTLTPALAAVAAKHGYSDHEARFIAERFENHWRSAGRNAAKLDWDRAWAVWVSRENRRQVQEGAKAWRNGAPNAQTPEQRRAERERIWRDEGVWNPKWGLRPDQPGYGGQGA